MLFNILRKLKIPVYIYLWQFVRMLSCIVETSKICVADIVLL